MPLEPFRASTHPSLVSTDSLRDRTIAVLGYGNQGHAHALNLRESGLRVVIGARPESHAGQRARDAGFTTFPHAEAAARGDLVIFALPDEVQRDLYERELVDRLREGATIGFIHGFAIRFGGLVPRDDLGVVLVAPKGPGTLLRDNFARGLGLPALLAVEQESSHGDAETLAFAWAAGIGAGRAGILRTTFADETETDLFGEQTVLCGGLTWLILAAFETLVEAGYPEELAYIECCHEVKQVADLIYANGPAAMMKAISNTAEFGAYHAGPRIVNDAARSTLRTLLEEIRNGDFARAFMADVQDGSPRLLRAREHLRAHSIESAGARSRDLMPWLGPAPGPDAAAPLDPAARSDPSNENTPKG